jgi:NAD(P)-dependent dehydrogenase (short-subunit alcohol dehydrogenase family)
MPLRPDDVQLRDRIALVTGAAVGIGAAIAETFAQFGADLALCDRNADALSATADRVAASGRRVRSAVLDVRDAEAVARFVAETAEAWDRIDVLVNNAGGTFQAPFLDVSARGQESLVHENFTSVTHFVRAVVPHMPDSGSIVNLTSIEAHRAGPGYAVYSAMKAAVENLTKSLALELGARGIRVNCIAPDVIPTPGTGPMDVGTPLVRQGHPDDVAGTALFLASDLSRFVTGSTVHVDGGNWAAGGWRRRADGTFAL